MGESEVAAAVFALERQVVLVLKVVAVKEALPAAYAAAAANCLGSMGTITRGWSFLKFLWFSLFLEEDFFFFLLQLLLLLHMLLLVFRIGQEEGSGCTGQEEEEEEDEFGSAGKSQEHHQA